MSSSRKLAATVLILLLGVAVAADKKQLAAAAAAVEENMKTSAGQEYDQRAGAEFGEKYVGTVRSCVEAQKTPPETFDMFLKLDGAGKVSETLVEPETDLSKCVQTALKTGNFSPPPKPDYWVNVHMQFKK